MLPRCVARVSRVGLTRSSSYRSLSLPEASCRSGPRSHLHLLTVSGRDIANVRRDREDIIMQIAHRLPSGGPLGRWCWAAASAPVGAHSWSPAGVGGSLDTPPRPAGCSEGLSVSKRGPAGGGSGC